ncbi:MAG TPA: hypothetical protein VGQ81_08490 [Acidobacteriota bacterium]|nr:hypothetical protein [Acidobacteriota bacterium]
MPADLAAICDVFEKADVKFYDPTNPDKEGIMLFTEDGATEFAFRNAEDFRTAVNSLSGRMVVARPSRQVGRRWRGTMMANGEENFWLYGKDGARYRAHVARERINTSSMVGASSMPGPGKVVLEDDTVLTPIDENTFKNVATGELLSRQEPKK